MNAGQYPTELTARHRLWAWLPVAIVAVVLLASVVTEAPARLPSRLCLFWHALGIPCPGCGMTRGFVAMGHGQIAEAWRSNPLSPALFVGACGYLVYSVLSRLGPARCRLRFPGDVSYVVWTLLFATIVGSWTLSLVRHFSGPPSGPASFITCLYRWAADG